MDFDDARNGPAVQDLWMLLSGDTDSRRYQLDILLDAYQEFCDFDTRELALIEPLRAMRMVHFYLGGTPLAGSRFSRISVDGGR